jgi:hypothetical protein
MEAPRFHPSSPTAPIHPSPLNGRTRRWKAAFAGPALLLAACSIVPTPGSAPVTGGTPAPDQPLGYVVCPNAVTPVELASHTAEAPIPLPVEGTPPLGSFAVATAPDGRSAYVVTRDTPPQGSARDVLIPIDLVTQQAGRPIVLPGTGVTHAVVVLNSGQIVLAAVGTTIVPVNPATRAIGTPLDLGPGRTVYGMALSPNSPMLYALVPGGVVPVDTATAQAGVAISTGLTVSSVSSPHGVVVSPNGSTVFVVGQGGSDYGGRLAPISTATGVVGTVTSFDQFGIADPAALTLTADGSTVLVADSANNWVAPVAVASLGTPSGPVRLPSGDPATAGTDHPSDIVTGPGATGVFVVAGLDTVLPFAPATETFGSPIRVCAGASSMAVSGS